MNTLSSLLKNLRNRTPVGTVVQYAGSTAPTDWLVCDGSAVSRTTYASLFAVIGTTYGAGNGSTTFNLPDARGRSAIGVGNGDATGHTNHALGSKGGNEDAIVPSHNHTATGGAVTNNSGFNTNSSGSCSISSSGGHGHTVTSKYANGAASGSATAILSTDGNITVTGNPAVTSNGAHTHTVPNHTHSLPAHGHGFTQPTISTVGSSTTGANMSPYLTFNFIIYAGTTA